MSPTRQLQAIAQSALLMIRIMGLVKILALKAVKILLSTAVVTQIRVIRVERLTRMSVS